MRILRKQNLEDLLFIDIETAPAEKELTPESSLWDAWEYKCIKDGVEDIAGSFQKEAALHGEFGVIVCISVGIVRNGKIRLKSFTGDEKQLLEDFNSVISTFVNNKTFLCGHVITGFDVPFIMKRCLVHRILPHIILDVAHLKPWEVSFLDTATLWKGTAFKMSTLVSVTACLGLESPKEDISGADVGRLFYEGDVDRIAAYCERDVKAVVDVVTALRGEDPLPVHEVEEEVEEAPKGVLTHLFEGGKFTKDMELELSKALYKMNGADRTRAIEILNALPTKAKGKATFITKKDIKRIAEWKPTETQ